MTDILEFFIVIFLLWIGLCAAGLLWRRIKLYRRINRLKKSANARIKYVKCPFLSLFGLSRKPEITVRIGKRLYLIRIFNGGGIGKVVHFANSEWAVRFSRLKTAVFAKRRAGEKIVNARSGFAIGTKVIRIPKIRCEEYAEAGAELVEALIFNPAPGEVTYVTEEKTSISGAFTGDTVLGTVIFTSSTFPIYAEREYRRENELAFSNTAGGGSLLASTAENKKDL